MNDSLATGARQSAVLKNVKQDVIIDSVDNKPLFYIINTDNGFTVVSADMRTMPILACSEEKNFNLNDIPPGVSVWMESAKSKIRDVKKKNETIHMIVAKEWKKYLSNKNGRVTDTNCIEWYQYGQFQC